MPKTKQQGKRRRASKKKAALQPGTRAARRAFSWDIRKAMYRQLMIQVKNDVPVIRSLEKFEARLLRTKREKAAEIIKAVRRAMEGGMDLDQALMPWVPGAEAAMIAGGVKGHNIPQALRELIEVESIRSGLIKEVRSGLTGPMLTLVFGLAMIVVVVKVIIPQFGAALPRSSATGLLAVLYMAGDLLSGWPAVVLAGAIVAGVVFVTRSLTRWTGPGRIFFEKFQPWRLYRDINGYLWLTGFISMYSAGIREVEAMQLQLKYATPWLAERLKAFLRDMGSGITLPAALSAERFKGKSFEFPSEDLVEIVDSLHGFPDFATSMADALKDWREEMTDEAKRVAKNVGFIGDVVSMGSMIFIGLAVISITNSLGGHMNIG